MFSVEFVQKFINDSWIRSDIPNINLLGELLKENDSLLIFGGEHQGKSTFAYSLILPLIADGYQWTDTKHSNILNLNNELTAPLKVFIYDTENYTADLIEMLGTKSNLLENNPNVKRFSLKDHWETTDYIEELENGTLIKYETFEAVYNLLEQAEKQLGYKFDLVLIDTASNMLPSDLKEQESIRQKYSSKIQAGRTVLMLWQFNKDGETIKGLHTLKTSIHNQMECSFNKEKGIATAKIVKTKRNGLTSTEIDFKLNDNYNSKYIVDIVDIKLSVQNSQQKEKLLSLMEKIKAKFKKQCKALPKELTEAIMEILKCQERQAKNQISALKYNGLIKQDKKGDPYHFVC